MLTRTSNNFFLDFNSSSNCVQKVLYEYGYTLSQYTAVRETFFEKDRMLIPLEKSKKLAYPYLVLFADMAKIPMNDFFASFCVLNTDNSC